MVATYGASLGKRLATFVSTFWADSFDAYRDREPGLSIESMTIGGVGFLLPFFFVVMPLITQYRSRL